MAAFASGWMRELVRPKSAPVPWARVFRCAVSITAPVALGAVVGRLDIGLLVAIGGLTGALNDRDAPYLARMTRMAVVAVGGTVGFGLGGLVLGDEVLTAVFVLAGGLVAALVSVLGGAASSAALQFLIYLIVASGVDFGPGPAWLGPACYLGGIAWALALSLVGGLGRSAAPERLAVAEVYRCLALVMESAGGPSAQADAARQKLTGAMNEAYDAVATRRTLSAGRDSHARLLAALVNAVTPAVETTTALVRSGTRVPVSFIARVREMSSEIRRGARGVPRPAGWVVSAQHPRAAWLRLLHDELDTVDEILEATRHARRPARPATTGGVTPVTRALKMAGMTTSVPVSGAGRQAIRSLRDAVASGPATWSPIVRLVLCLAVAEAVAILDPEPRPYWIAMTVAIVLKPDFGSVFARAVQRGTGTIVGVLLGSVVLALAPGVVLPIVAIAILSALLPVAVGRNYGMYATFLTPLIVLLLDLGQGASGPGGAQLVVSRLVDTVLGCVIVLLVGYVPWPDTWRSRGRLGARFATAVVAVRDYVTAALGAPADPGPSRQSARRTAYRALSDLRTYLQQSLAEPPAVSAVAAGWWPAVVALERVTDAVTGVVVGARAGRARPGADGVRRVVTALDVLAGRLRGEPAEAAGAATSSTVTDPALAGVWAELRTAQAVFGTRTPPPGP
ncbi:MAG TPA: FUSC family protein [Microbacteriaceae bacterium]|nr:FUSC family protein [Microbacteriaceae bacterium]